MDGQPENPDMSVAETPFIVLVCGRDSETLVGVEAELSAFGEMTIVRETISGTSSFAAEYVGTVRKINPDAVVFCMGSDSSYEVSSLAKIQLIDRPRHLVLLKLDNALEPLSFRLSLQTGAMDLIDYPSEANRLPEVLSRIQAHVRKGVSRSGGITLVLSATGGTGASTIAAGLVNAMVKTAGRKALLMDLDIQFGTQYLNHDIAPDKGLKEALEHLSEMDPSALMGYVSPHPAGFDLIGCLPDQVYLESDLPMEKLTSLLDLVAKHYPEVVLDLPCHVGALMSQSLSIASRILLVVHQDLASIKNARKLLDILCGDFDVPPERITYVINKFSTAKAVQAEDISNALGIKALGSVPDEPLAVQNAGSLGIPIAQHAPRSRSVKAIDEMAIKMAGIESNPSKVGSFLNRLKSFGGRS